MATFDGSVQLGGAGGPVPGGRFSHYGQHKGAAAPLNVPGVPAGGTRYKLACFDTGGTRRYWESMDIVLTDAPTPTGSYVLATLVVQGTVL